MASNMASDFEEGRSFYFEAKASKMDKIDDALRLKGLKFPEGILVIGRKDADLLIALGAVNLRRNIAGNQIAVTQRLCVLYHAVIDIGKTNPSIGIISDAFYEAAIHKISKKHPGMSKYLTAESLRHVIDLYLRAFVRSGMKLQKPIILSFRLARDVLPVAQNNGEGAEASIVEKPRKLFLEKHSVKGSREELKELVAEWGAIRGAARHDNTLAAQSAADEPEIIGDTYPEKLADESDSSYIVRLQQFCQHVCDENKQYKKDVTQEKTDQVQLQKDNDLLTKKHDELTKDYDELMVRFDAVVLESDDLMAKYDAVVDESEKLETESVEQREEIIDLKKEATSIKRQLRQKRERDQGKEVTDLKKEITKLKTQMKEEREHHEIRTDQRETRIELMQDTIDSRQDEIDELKRRLGIPVRWEHPHDRADFPSGTGGSALPGFPDDFPAFPGDPRF